MGEIQKPDVNPLVVGLANIILPLGYWMIGQRKKALISLLIYVIVVPCTFGVGFLWGAVVAYDAYMLAQRLEQGESIGENENAVAFLNAVFRD